MVSREELVYQAWELGILEYKVRDFQLPIYEAVWTAIKTKSTLKYCLNIARRFGKTHIVTLVAIEYAIRHPGSSINYASGTDKAMKKILSAIFPVIMEDCPAALKPKLVGGVLTFPNGSKIYTAGVNNQHADDLRGTSSHLNIVDEAGMIDDLEYLVRSVLMPQQLTVNGTMILLSTPPPTVDHDYAKLYHECAEENAVSTFTVYDNADVMADPDKFNAFVKEAGGVASTTWKREYECVFVTDTDKLIIPEWVELKSQCQVDTPKTRLYRYYTKHVGMDLGFRHNTCLIFGYVDFLRQKVVIEDEAVLNGAEVTSASIAGITKTRELELWGKPADMRISDNNNPILLNDISLVHNIQFHGTSKDELDAMISQTRLFIGAKKLEINPKCEYLLACLEFGVWNKKRSGFAESRKYGHYDALAALIYMLRYCDMLHNPIPKNLDIASPDLMLPAGRESGTASATGLKDWTNKHRINTRNRKDL